MRLLALSVATSVLAYYGWAEILFENYIFYNYSYVNIVA
jgi:hypothetical protein